MVRKQYKEQTIITQVMLQLTIKVLNIYETHFSGTKIYICTERLIFETKLKWLISNEKSVNMFFKINSKIPK